MKPFYFGDSGRPLFGVYHPPHGPRRRTGVILCPPFGQEYVRAHRSLRELAEGLAGTGFHALRFDYHGCGDSAGEGEEARIAEWTADIVAAVAEVRELAGSANLALLGLRLGGTLASRAASGGERVDALVLWDPVIEGASYLRELREAHQTWIDEHARGVRQGRNEVLGFPLPEALAEDIAGLRLEASLPARRALLVSSDEGEAVPTHWSDAPPGTVERRRFPPAPVWLQAEGVERALVPGALLDFVVAWLGASCP